MVLPVVPNRVFDLYHSTNAPPAAPDLAALPGFLTPDFRRGDGPRFSGTLPWTHVLLVEPGVDIRDGYTGQGSITVGDADLLYAPDNTGTPFRVVFIERVNYGLDTDHKRCYLDRLTPPSWPTDEL